MQVREGSQLEIVGVQLNVLVHNYENNNNVLATNNGWTCDGWHTLDSSLYSWNLSLPRSFVRTSLAICSSCGHMSIVNVFLKNLLPHKMMMCFWDAWFVHEILGYVQFSNNSCCCTNFLFKRNHNKRLILKWNNHPTNGLDFGHISTFLPWFQSSIQFRV
jgi:hypothetical protein